MVDDIPAPYRHQVISNNQAESYYATTIKQTDVKSLV